MNRAQGLQFGQLNDVAGHFRKAVTLFFQCRGKGPHLIGIIRGILEGFGEQRDSANGGFEFVRNVGDKVTSNRVQKVHF